MAISPCRCLGIAILSAPFLSPRERRESILSLFFAIALQKFVLQLLFAISLLKSLVLSLFLIQSLFECSDFFIFAWFYHNRIE